MFCALEVGLLVWGIITLAKGTVSLTKNKVIRGTPAYVMGVLMMLPLPAAFLAGAVIGAVMTVKNQGVAPEGMFVVLTAAEWVLVLGFSLIIVLIGLVHGRTQAEWDAMKAAEQDYGVHLPGPLPLPSNNPYESPREFH